MNPDPKQLLQIIHNRGEQCWINPIAVEQARAAAQELAKWIDSTIRPEPTIPVTPNEKQ
jgi:hypothetical protein